MKKRNYLIAMALGFTVIMGGCGSTASRQTPPVTIEQGSSQNHTQNTVPTETAIQNIQQSDAAIQNTQPADTIIQDTQHAAASLPHTQQGDASVQNTQQTDASAQNTQQTDTSAQNTQQVASAAQNTQVSDSFVQNAQPSPGSSTTINTESLQPGNINHAPAASNTSSQIGEAQALQIALSHAGVQSSDLAFSYAHGDFDDGRPVYDVEFFAGNTEYDYEIDATTGNILDFDYDMESHFTPNNTQPVNPPSTPSNNTNTGNTNAAAVSIETAKQTALSRVSGATDSHIRIQTDYDDGRTVYEGKIIYNEIEYDFEIDAATGQITDWEAESIYD